MMNKFQLYRLIEVVRLVDIVHNPTPEAIFVPLTQGFKIFCTPDDNPEGDWRRLTEHMIAGAYTKPCEHVAQVLAQWGKDGITHFSLSTDAYALERYLPNEYTSNKLFRRSRKSIHNRPDDIAWAKKKIAWIFVQAGMPYPMIKV